MKAIRKFISVFTIALLGAGAALTIDHYIQTKNASYLAETSIRNPMPVRFAGMSSLPPEGSTDFVSAAQKGIPAVVYIESKIQMQDETSYNSIWDYFYGQSHPNMIEGQVSGSGVIVSSDGYIVTNNHVVDDAAKIEVTLSDRKKYTATVIGKDPATDLALLKIDATNLPYLEYGNSDDLQVGQWVLAVGNPFNLISTVTAGIVSAKGRNIDLLPREEDASRRIYPIESYIQTDAAVNPGNSGGALINTSGQLVGINSAIASNTGSYTGYSFAIPVNLVRKVVADLLQYGSVQRAFIGVNIRNVDEEMAKNVGLPDMDGAYVDSVIPGGAAKLAGIKQGDIILKVGDQNVKNVSSLEELVGRYRPGDHVNVTINRSGQQISIPVTLRNLDGTTTIVKNTGQKEFISELGASLAPLSDEEKQRLNIDGGAKVAQLGEGVLKETGVQRGFIITRIDHQKVKSPEDARNILQQKSGGVLVEGVYPNGTRAYYAFGM